VIVGTAGHIDHGKTTLVRALTGVDTDRLKEEKARGISIELGYAYAPLPKGDVLGYVDVPGHERLVHTMAAGACGIDFALLVVAADDGVMPQTREHLAILDLLGVSRGAVAMTKVDRVDAARVGEVRTEIADALKSTALRDAAVFALDATLPDDPRVAALRAHLHEAAANLQARRDDGLFRLAVDRVFTLPGHGTMVAGTVFSGRVESGDTLALMPAGTPVRIRSIHAQNRASASGRAGQRCALNLAGVAKDRIERGNWIADPRLLAPTSRIDVRLQLLGDTDARVTQWSPLHVHLGAAHCVAHVVLLDGESLVPGQAARAQFVFDTPVCAMTGDRFIVRNAQATRTIGGGRVLDPYAPARKRRTPQRRRYLDALEGMLAGQGVEPLLHQAPQGLRTSELVRLTGEARQSFPADAIIIDAPPEHFAILRMHWNALRDDVVAALRDFHAGAPDDPGPDSARLRRIAAPELHAAMWRALIDELIRDGAVIRNGVWLHLPGHALTLSESDETLARKLLPLIEAGHFDPPWVRDLAGAVHEDEEHVRQLLRKLVRQGRVFQIVPDLFYARQRMRELADVLDAQVREHGTVEAAKYRDAIGLGRKRTIQILEFFDRLGYTRRVRSAHVLRSDGSWFA
jgi:selenocysteine-specific elongation factor